MTKDELIKAAADLGVEVDPKASKAEIEKAVKAATEASAAADDDVSDSPAAETAVEPSPGPAEPEMVTYGPEVADLVAVVTVACSTPFEHSFLTFKPGDVVEGLLASQLVDAGLAAPKE